MSKELRALEALESLMKDYYEMCEDTGNNDDQYQKWNKTSERAIIEKALKALEIIKEKRVNVGLLLRCATVERYNKGICYEPKHLTQEEFDLLKEVML